jgi:hypothetical protein
LDIVHHVFHGDGQKQSDIKESFPTAENRNIFAAPISKVLGNTEESGTLWICRSSARLIDLMEPFSKGRALILMFFSDICLHE